MINRFKELEDVCNHELDDTAFEDRTPRQAEFANICFAVRMEIKFLEAGEPATETTTEFLYVLRDRLTELMNDPESAGRHDAFKEELQICDDLDEMDDL